ncbi:unnamed protein product [Phytomonas sp. Hart1]|nr:unnamed protein product [Phytomonas sp. Hart1]|eukprot:CCW68287.1 unnamed protein product [Phytomonas sp. isolate Hart1]
MTSIEAQKRQLYNRQEYVVGAETQAKYDATDIVVVGAGGLGAEIVKNLILTGVRSVTIIDDAPVQRADLGTNFFLKIEDLGKPRGLTVALAARRLNRFVEVTAGVGTDPFPAAHVVIYAGQPIAGLVEANARARRHGVGFVGCESRGIAGGVFVDGGDAFTVVDADGEEAVVCVVIGITRDGIVTLYDQKHECEVGSLVYFTGLLSPVSANSGEGKGGPQRVCATPPRLFEVSEVISPHILRVKDFPNDAPVIIGKSTHLHTTKKSLRLSFHNLRDAIKKPQFVTIFDGESKSGAASTLHAVFRAVTESGIRPESIDEMKKVLHTALAMDSSLDVELARKVLAVYTGDLNPMTCFIGAIAAQEALKLCSGKFTPIYQWLYYDTRELLRDRPGTPEEWLEARRSLSDSRYIGQEIVLGAGFQSYMHRQCAFIVGAGALGCEHIKNIALMGLGGVTITDMDNIELSNLSRQFLFRSHHIGSAKSIVAAAAAREINPGLHTTSYEEKIGSETEGIFNETFWNSHSVVLGALDNVGSRKYVDGRCLFYKRPLFESGTLGAKGNIQCVIPYVTESYSSSYDPPEKSIPLCTLKNFPNAIEHTIQWARDKFHLLFQSSPGDVNAYLKDPKAFEVSLELDPAGASLVLKRVNDTLRGWPTTPDHCIRAARLLYEEFFNEVFKQLMYNIPLDKRNEDGELFWSGGKKPPTPQIFNPDDEFDAQFVYHCAWLLAKVFNHPPLELSVDDVAKRAAAVVVPDFVPRHAVFATTEKETKDTAAVQLAGEIQIQDLPSPALFTGKTMDPLEFEKDDATNHHIEFITYCSNLRARAYGIPSADLAYTKRIAGNITPAMVTTTALVTGMVGFELLKYLYVQYQFERSGNSGSTPFIPSRNQANELLSYYRNAFVNIALPFLAFSDPILTEVRTYSVDDKGTTISWTVWDHIDINEGKEISMEKLVSLLEERYHLSVFMLALPSGRIVYTQFGGKAKDKIKLVSQIAIEKGESLQEGDDYLNFVGTGMIGDEEDVDVPLIRYKFQGF